MGLGGGCSVLCLRSSASCVFLILVGVHVGRASVALRYGVVVVLVLFVLEVRVWDVGALAAGFTPKEALELLPNPFPLDQGDGPARGRGLRTCGVFGNATMCRRGFATEVGYAVGAGDVEAFAQSW